jgi:hypothetical protein
MRSGGGLLTFHLCSRRHERINSPALVVSFSFRIDGGVCELYWLCADSTERLPNEPWKLFAERSIDEVRAAFERLCDTADFEKEISNWPYLREKRNSGCDPMQSLWFIAYFESEEGYASLRK